MRSDGRRRGTRGWRCTCGLGTCRGGAGPSLVRGEGVALALQSLQNPQGFMWQADWEGVRSCGGFRHCPIPARHSHQAAGSGSSDLVHATVGVVRCCAGIRLGLLARLPLSHEGQWTTTTLWERRLLVQCAHHLDRKLVAGVA